MTIPGYDEDLVNKHNAKFTFHNVAEKKYYSLNLNSVAQGENKIDATGYYAVIDSGTSVIVGPKQLVDPMIKDIKVRRTCKGVEDLPNLTWTIDGIDYVLTPKDYVLSVTQDNVTECVLGIQAGEFPPGFNYFILGDSFMRRYYSFFDKDNDRVGFIDTNLFKEQLE